MLISNLVVNALYVLIFTLYVLLLKKKKKNGNFYSSEEGLLGYDQSAIAGSRSSVSHCVSRAPLGTDRI